MAGSGFALGALRSFEPVYPLPQLRVLFREIFESGAEGCDAVFGRASTLR